MKTGAEIVQEWEFGVDLETAGQLEMERLAAAIDAEILSATKDPSRIDLDAAKIRVSIAKVYGT
jgi:hypothetical protein